MADSPRLAEIEALQRRQEELLAGMQMSAEYPDLAGSVGDFERDARVPGANDRDGIMTTSDALPEGTGDFAQATTNRYEYKPEFAGAQGTAPGPQVGPMSRDLKGIPGVVKPGPDGMDRVDTSRLSLANASATGENAREIAALRKRLDALAGATSGGDDEALSAARSGRF
jgi:hypothetical protein